MSGPIIFATIEAYDGLEQELKSLFSALRERGFEPRAEKLDDIQHFFACPVVLQTTSGYHLQLSHYLEALQNLESLGFQLINPLATIRWNSDKHYLKELADKGHRVIPTLWLEWQMPVIWDMLWEGIASPHMVVKPTISAGAHQTRRILHGQEGDYRNWLITQLEQQAMMAQPFVPEVEDEGEWSFVFFGGKLSHTVLKTARRGDWRVQHVHGGRYHAVTPPPALLADAEAVLADLPANHYARVDGVQRDGHLLLMEVELIEPFLYLLPEQANVNNAADALAAAARSAMVMAA